MTPGPLALRIGVAVRHRRLAAAGVAVLVAVGVGVVLTLAAGARRTASAPERYTASVGGDVDTMLVQPNGRPQTDAVRALPVVRELHSVTFLTAGVDGHDDVATFAGDGFTEARLVAGRQPVASHEFVVTKSFTDGDTVVQLHLNGDSAIGALDGPTRKLPKTCRADVQQWNVDGAAETIAGFNLARVEDVSR